MRAVDDPELLQALLDSPGSHAIVVTDLKGVVKLWNRGACRIFGFEAGEIVGHDAAILFVANDRRNGIPAMEMQRALRDVRLSLLEGDVEFRVVKRFLERVKEQARGKQVELKAKSGTVKLDSDEHFRKGTTAASLAKLPPVFRKDGTVAAGNASGRRGSA